ncbi:restriction endonuclease subunit S [Pseudomonas sp. LP_7_YM]|uniref:restriction endonuclease subunit S n=1 Tax=Pseudomonas sp. LP_7_YM TaxID=2485137 RepID=UPI00105F4AC7|nr:restriction endonuclease subunit S [Pseudomonas sp. LP_7_YM]TDV61813.1 type I restriction enzyme S subunit [Pseudomonas sp. LP_7_YM]
MTSPTSVKLGDVAKFVRGISFKPEDIVSADAKNSVACLRTKNIQSELELSDVWAVNKSLVRRPDQFLQFGDILVSSANSWNLIGKCNWIPELPKETSFGGFVTVLRADPERILPRFLYWWFSSKRVQALVRSFGNKTTSISNLNIGRCLSLLVELPCLSEQRRVASILDKASELNHRRRETIRLLDRLEQSIFMKMFGDPLPNLMTWPRMALAELIEEVESGHSPVCLDRRVRNSEWGVLKLGAITKCSYISTENKALPTENFSSKYLEVKSGDLLFSRKNTHDHVAACAYVRETPPNLLIPDLMFRFRFPEDTKILPQFLHALLVFPSKRKSIQKLASGSSGSMPNISKANLKNTLIEVPPIELQRKFVSRINEIEVQRQKLVKSSVLLNDLFASLQHRAFRGEL